MYWVNMYSQSLSVMITVALLMSPMTMEAAGATSIILTVKVWVPSNTASSKIVTLTHCSAPSVLVELNATDLTTAT